jgi:hypothetical protein
MSVYPPDIEDPQEGGFLLDQLPFFCSTKEEFLLPFWHRKTMRGDRMGVRQDKPEYHSEGGGECEGFFLSSEGVEDPQTGPSGRMGGLR